jgi:hypothetical protein
MRFAFTLTVENNMASADGLRYFAPLASRKVLIFRRSFSMNMPPMHLIRTYPISSVISRQTQLPSRAR